MKEQKEVDLNAELNQMIWAQKKELEFPPLEPVTKNKITNVQTHAHVSSNQEAPTGLCPSTK